MPINWYKENAYICHHIADKLLAVVIIRKKIKNQIVKNPEKLKKYISNRSNNLIRFFKITYHHKKLRNYSTKPLKIRKSHTTPSIFTELWRKLKDGINPLLFFCHSSSSSPQRLLFLFFCRSILPPAVRRFGIRKTIQQFFKKQKNQNHGKEIFAHLHQVLYLLFQEKFFGET